jgi:hypothetical protein
MFRRTDGGVFAADVINHNGGHDDGDDVDEARRWQKSVNVSFSCGHEAPRTRLE